MLTVPATAPRVNTALPLARLATDFSLSRRIQIPDFLETDLARDVRLELENSAQWRRVIHGGGKVFEMASDRFDALPPDQRAAVDQAVIQDARRGFQYRYDVIRVPDDPRERDGIPTRLASLATLMNTPETLAILRHIAGDDDIAFADIQATRYVPGDFLTRHDDAVAGKNRRLAYVLGLTPGWQPEWGGLLIFTDEKGRLVDAMAPRFNALCLFSVPQAHSVTYVAPYADGKRVSVTGWLRSSPPSAH